MFRQKPFVLFVALVMIMTFATSVMAQNYPTGAEDVTEIQSEAGNAALYTPNTTVAEAGNLTELTISGVTQTKSWQGFYGNVTGTIILEDSQGFRFYDWAAAEPQGEVYASVNQTISWSTVACAPTQTDIDYLNTWQTFYGMNYTDYDTINKTYNISSHPEFDTGYTSFSTCPTTYTFVNDAAQYADFPAVLLTSDSDGTLIFTAILEDKAEGERDDKVGYDGEEYDFQLLVAEFGSDGNNAVTPYYFWVELQ